MPVPSMKVKRSMKAKKRAKKAVAKWKKLSEEEVRLAREWYKDICACTCVVAGVSVCCL